MFIETNDILINVDNITKIYYSVYDSIPKKPGFEIHILTNDGDSTILRFETEKEFKHTWEWIRWIVPR